MNLIVGIFIRSILVTISNVGIDYIIRDKDNKFIKKKKEFYKSKEIIFTNLFSIVMEISLFILIGQGNFFYMCYAMTLIFFRIAIIDYKTKYIDNKLLIMFLVISIVSLVINNNGSFLNCLLTGVGAYLIFSLMSKLTNEAIGKGDAKIFGVLGLIFGFNGLLSILFGASMIVFCVSIFLLIKSRENKNKELPFTPYIFASLILMLIVNNI